MGKQRNNLPASIAGVSLMERKKKIPLADAAAHNSIRPETFKSNCPHLVLRVGKRRLFVTVEDAIMLPPPDTS
jgi:hypothetical protein